MADLTLAEAIFMASIIPRPKRFMFSSMQDQRLRPWLQAYYRDVSGKMLRREMISQQDYDTLVPDIRLRAPPACCCGGRNRGRKNRSIWPRKARSSSGPSHGAAALMAMSEATRAAHPQGTLISEAKPPSARSHQAVRAAHPAENAHF